MTTTSSIARRGFALALFTLSVIAHTSSFATTIGDETAAHTLLKVEVEQRFETLEAFWVDVRSITKSYSDGAFELAFKEAQARDSNRNPFVAYWLGRMLVEGRGTEKDVSRGVALLEFAEKQGVGRASQLLCQAYAGGKLIERNIELARIHQLRWIDFEIAYATYRNRDFSLMKTLFDRDKAQVYRYWQQRLKYMQRLRVYDDFNRLRNTFADPTKPSTAVKPGAMPVQCRPSAPPRAQMAQLKVDTVSGDVYFFVDSNGRVDGMALGEITEPRLTIAAMRTFDIALQEKDCVLPESLANRLVQIPFTFRLE